MPYRVEKAGYPSGEGVVTARVSPGRIVGSIFTLGLVAILRPIRYFDPWVVDRKILVNSDDALRATRELTAREGIFAGISSGAVVHVAQRISAEIDDGDVVCLLADGGWKYLSTDAWAAELDVAEKKVSESLWW